MGQRLGLTRVPPQLLHNCSFLLLCVSVTLVRRSKKPIVKLACIAFCLFMFYYIVFAWLTRQIVYKVFLFAAYLAIPRFNGKAMIRCLLLAVAIGVGMAFVSSDVRARFTRVFVDMVTGPFREAEQGAGTIGVRISGIEYYYGLYADTAFIGIGNVDSTAGESFVDPRGKAGDYNLNDMGIMDSLFRFGVPAIVFIFVVLYQDGKGPEKGPASLPT